MTYNKDSTRYYSERQEKVVAKALNGRQTANSGATMFSKGDVKTSHFLIECKTLLKSSKSISIKKEWIIKNKEEAFQTGKDYGVLAFNFGENSENYYVIDENLMKYLMEKINEEYKN